MDKKLSPIILLGAGRSGTKFLRSVLAASDEVAPVPYDVGYVWRYGNEMMDSDEFPADALDERIIAYIHKTLPMLVDKKNKAGARFFVEKSVPNTLRPEFVYKVYPNAKYIHLIRDGRNVTESAMRMWKQPPNKLYLLKKLRYFPWSNYKYAFWYFKNIIKAKMSNERGQNIWGPRYKGIEDDAREKPLVVVCAKQWRKCVEVCQQQIKRIPSEQLFEVKYEDLLNDSGKLEEMCTFLSLSDPDRVATFFRDNVIKGNAEPWKGKMSQKDVELMMKEIAPTLESCGYIGNKGVSDEG